MVATSPINLKPVATTGTAYVYAESAGGAVIKAHVSPENVLDYGAAADGVTDDIAKVRLAEAALTDGGVVLFPDGPYSLSNTTPAAGMTWRFAGAPVPRSTLGGAAAFNSLNADYSYLTGPHTTSQLVGQYFRSLAKGSGQIGQSYSDQAVSIHVQKEHWSETSGTPSGGEINGLTIMYRQGGPRVGDPDPMAGYNSGAGLLFNIQATDGSGASQVIEAVNTTVDPSGLAINRQIGVQVGMLNTRDSDYYGLVLISTLGTQDSAILCQNVVGNTWGRILENWIGSDSNYYIDANAKHRWRTLSTDAVPSTSLTMEQEAASADLVFKNNSGTEIFRVGQTRTTARPNDPVVDTTTARTITQSDHNRIIVMANAGAIAVTLSDIAKIGTSVRVIQRDAGQITFAAAGTGTLRNRSSHTKTAGQYAVVTLEVGSNSGGSSAIWYLSGDTAA